MTAASVNRNRLTIGTKQVRLPVAASTTIYENTMVAMDTSGNARPARASTSDRVIGRAKHYVYNSGSAGAEYIEVDMHEIACFANSSSTDAITLSHLGQQCYAVDDSTVALTTNSDARIRAGQIAWVDSNGVWVQFGQPGTLRHVTVALADVSAASSAYICSPYRGRVVRVQGTLSAAITTADSAVTTSIAGVAITGGGFTAAFTASAPGTLFRAFPTAANTVAAGNLLTVTSDGASSTTSILTTTFTIDIG